MDIEEPNCDNNYDNYENATLNFCFGPHGDFNPLTRGALNNIQDSRAGWILGICS